MSTKHSVIFDPFTKRHYIKNFKKKYSHRVWEVLKESIIAMLQNPHVSIEKNKIETIRDQDGVLLGKIVNLKIPGRKKSGRKSGYRCIVSIDTETKSSRVLLLYHKGDLPGAGGETAQWKRLIKKHLPEYAYLVD